MKFVTVDCSNITSRAEFHEALAKALSFPDWYGKNLDALHDCLTDIFEDTRIQFEHWEILEAHLGSYSAAIQWAMTHAAGENPAIQVYFD